MVVSFVLIFYPFVSCYPVKYENDFVHALMTPFYDNSYDPVPSITIAMAFFLLKADY